MPVIRVHDSFSNQLLKAKSVLTDFLGREVTLNEITEKLYLKVVVTNESPLPDDIFADWKVRPIILVVNGVVKRKQMNKRALLQPMGEIIPKKRKEEYDFIPNFKSLWR